MVEYPFIIVLIVLLVIAINVSLYPYSKKNIIFQMVILFFFSIGSGVGYWEWGGWRSLTEYQQEKYLKQQALQTLKSVKNYQELVKKLKQHLEIEPGSGRGWFLLGRLYARQSEWQSALDAFKRASELEPENEEVSVQYAQGLWQLNEQKFNPTIRSIFQTILKKNPRQPDALSMLAMDAFQEKAYRQAIQYWTTLLSLVPPNSADAKAIRKAISRARSLKHFPHGRGLTKPAGFSEPSPKK